MLRSVVAPLVLVFAAAPVAATQEAGTFGLEEAKAGLAEITSSRKWTREKRDRYDAWVGSVRRVLAERSVPELRNWLRTEGLTALRRDALSAKKLQSSLTIRDTIYLCLALDHGPAVDDALNLLGEWQKKSRREIASEQYAVLEPIADLSAVDKLTPKQRAMFRKQLAWVIKYGGAGIADAIPAIERLGDRWAVELLTDDALDRAIKQGFDAQLLLKRIAQSLGRWWDSEPQLDLRIPALVKLAGVQDDEVRTAGLEGLERMLLGWSAGSPTQTKRAIAKEWKTHKHDAPLLLALLTERRDRTDELARFASDAAARLRELKRRESPWASPLFMEVFGWPDPQLAEVRSAAIECLIHNGDRTVVPQLLKMLEGLADPGRRALAIRAIGSLERTSGDPPSPSETVKRLLLTSIKTGKPLDQEAAARALGQLQLADGVDPLLHFGDAGTYAHRVVAWQALARIGTARAEAGLVERFDAADAADRLPIMQALADWKHHPVSDALATRIGTAWDQAGNFDLKTAAVVAATGRGLAHPSLLPRVRRLLVDGTSPPEHTDPALQRVLQEFEPQTARRLLLAVLEAGPDAPREAAALAWLRGRPGADLRATALRIAADAERSDEVRTGVTGVLGLPNVWDAAAVGTPLITLLSRTSGHDALAPAIRDALLPNADATLVPSLIALLPKRAITATSTPERMHADFVKHLLWAWGQRTSNEKHIPGNKPAVRSVWSAWWKDAAKAGVTFR